MSRTRVTFLCRGSTEVGLGHVMRTRAVADALAADGRTVVRLVAIGDDAAASLLATRTYPVHVARDEAEATAAAAATRPHVVVLDTTTLSRAGFDRVAAGARTASLSPVFDRLEDVDACFHRARRHPDGRRPGWRLGPEWAVVRPEVVPIPDDRYAAATDPTRPLPVAVCMGGGDAANDTRRILERLRAVDRPLLVWALLGKGYRHSIDELERTATADRRHEVILARTTHSMWHVLRDCALAVLAGGTVTYEAAAAGLPSVNLLADPARAWLVEDLVDAGAAFLAGGPEPPAAGHDPLVELVTRLSVDRAALRAARHAARGLVDGGGTGRIAEALRAMAAGEDAATTAAPAAHPPRPPHRVDRDARPPGASGAAAA